MAIAIWINIKCDRDLVIGAIADTMQHQLFVHGEGIGDRANQIFHVDQISSYVRTLSMMRGIARVNHERLQVITQRIFK